MPTPSTQYWQAGTTAPDVQNANHPMHACDLVEAAALIAQQAPALIHSTAYVSESGLQKYWTASKCRAERWMRELPTLDVDRGEGRMIPVLQPAAWNQPLMEEVLAGEMLTRVWTGIACGIDARHGQHLAESIARNVWVGQLEARHRILQLLVGSQDAHHRKFTNLNALRRRLERWTDMLIGCVLPEHDASEFAFDPDRADEFRRDLRRDVQCKGETKAWLLIMSALQSAFRGVLTAPSPNADLNSRIVASLMGSFSAEMFDAVGDLRWLWQVRLANSADDIQSLLESLVEDEARQYLESPPRPSLRFGTLRPGKPNV